MDAGRGGSASNDLPWSSVFDAAANMRALSAVQADGFRAASELVDRFVRMASAGLTGYGQPAQQADPSTEGQRADLFGATGLEPFVTSWWAMVDQFVRISAPRAEQPGAAGPPTLDLATGVSSGCVRLEATSPGTATAEVWLHNAATRDEGKIRLRCSALLAHDGTSLPADLLRLEPDVVPMPSRSSRGVTVEVAVEPGTPGGSYRGMVLADGHPDVWLPVELVVAQVLPQ